MVRESEGDQGEHEVRAKAKAEATEPGKGEATPTEKGEQNGQFAREDKPWGVGVRAPPPS